MKHLKLIFACLLVTILSIGQVWAVDPTISWDFKTLQTTSGTQSGITWETGKTGSATATACNGTNGLVLYGVASGGGYFQTTSAISGTITNVNIVSTAKKNTPKYTVYCSTDGSTWDEIAAAQTAGTKDHAVTGSYTYVKVANTTAATAQLGVASITVTYTPSGGGSTPTLSLTPSSKEFDATGNSAQDIALTPSNFSSAVSSVTCAFYSEATCATSISRPSWVNEPTVNGTKTQVSVNVADNDGPARQTWMKITASDGSDEASAVFAISQKAYVAEFATLPFSFTGGRADIATTSGMSQEGLGTDYTGVTAKLKFDGIGDWLKIKFNEAPGTLSYDIRGNGFKDGVFNVWESPDGGEYTLIYQYGESVLDDPKSESINLSQTTRYVMFRYQQKASGNVGLGNIAISEYVAPAAVATPVISGNTSFLTSTEVSITCDTEGATIYYTTDNTDPKTSGTKLTYSAPFTVNADGTTTVRAYAVKGSDASDVASKEFTKITPYTTLAAIYTKATEVGGTATDIYVTFDGWKISGKSSSNAFLTDGTNGLIIYANSHGFNVGDVLTGTAACKVQLYKNSAELTTLTSSTTGLTVTSGSMSDPVVKTIDALSAVNTGALVKVENLVYDGTNFSDGVNTIAIHKTLYDASSLVESGKTYTLSGVFQLYDATKQILPRSAADVVEIVEEGAPEAPTFSPAAGTYTSVQSVELSCATDGAAIYYTTDGTTPTASSTLYSSAISVGVDMTIKAIAIKNDKSSSLATAAYTINLPENPETSKTWDLSIVSCDADPTDELMQWSATYVTMTNEKGTGTKVTNYYPGTSGKTYTSTRFYNGNILTITPSGKQITTIVFTATSESYASALASSTWTNATAAASGSTVTVTATSGIEAVSAAIGGTCGFTAVKVNYTAIDPSLPVAPTFTPAAGTYTSAQSVELSCATDGAAIYYTTDGTTPTSASTLYSSAIPVEEDMTIKAIAIKDAKSGPVATAAYVINLPVDESTTKTWDLSINETASATPAELTWSATYVDMSYAKGESTSPANNYYPGTSGQSYTSTRFYKDGVLTITPTGKQITTIVFTATSESYATALKNSTWTNATAAVSSTTVTVTASGIEAVSATISGTCGITAVTVNYTDIDPSIPIAPTFTPAAGTYTSIQSVELSCATDGAAIYYTTDGSTPTSESTLYSSAISVGVNMTIKAIAIKDAKSGPVATAAYVIDLPVDESTTKTWDLSIVSCDADPTDELMQWSATYVTMTNEKGTGTKVTNYYPGTSGKTYTSTRFYNGNILTITPSGKQITTIVFTATSESYATALASSTWTNATAAASGTTVTVTASGIGAVSATIGNTCGFTAVTVNYITLDPSIPVAPTFTPAAGTYSSVQSVTLACETTGAAIYYTTDGSTPTSESTLYSSAISVGVNMTIKAIAIKDAKSGPVATANYVINLPLTSMDAIFTKATDVKTTATDVNVTFGSWVISGVSTNGKQAYLTDGTKGLIIFDNSAAMGFNVGDVLTGTAACKVQLYNGASELTTLSSTTEGLSVATGGSVTPVVKAISDLSGINTGAPVTINNVWFDGTNLTDGTNSIQPYNTLFAYEEFTENKYYNVTGIYLQFGSKKEILPRKAADIEELSISAPSMIWYTSNAKAVEIAANATHSIGLYEAFAPVFETNSEGAKTYSSTNESVASIDAATGELTVNGVGDTEIRCAVTANGDYAAGSQAFTLHVTENAAEENVVIVAKFGNQWLAMKHDLTAVEVYFAGGKIVNADAETQAAITWKRTVDEENVTFQTSDNKYLKTGSSTTLSVEANASGSYIWTWNSTYYRTGESTRTFLYQGNAAKFKNYTASNAGKANDGGYSELPIVTRAVFTTDAHVRDLTTMTGNYGTICLPYQVNAGDYTGASFYEVAYRDGMETVFVDEVKTLEAGKPYIFVRQQDLLVAVYSGSPVADPISVNGAYGTFSRIEFNNGELTAEDYILSRDMLWKCYADYGLNAYRAYFKVAEITTDVPAPKFGKRRLAIGTPNNTPTELENINNSEIQAVRKIMIDGHLYIVRDGKFFDATGRLVK